MGRAHANINPNSSVIVKSNFSGILITTITKNGNKNIGKKMGGMIEEKLPFLIELYLTTGKKKYLYPSKSIILDFTAL